MSKKKTRKKKVALLLEHNEWNATVAAAVERALKELERAGIPTTKRDRLTIELAVAAAITQLEIEAERFNANKAAIALTE